MSEPGGRESRVRAVVVIAIVGVAAMLVPSAYAAHHGLPHWAAAAIALVAFPVLPLAWHLVGERRRRRRGAAKRGLTGTDRFVLRAIAVALVAIAPLVALAPGGVWRALRHDGLWWLDWSGPSTGSPVRDHRLLDAVPPDAEILLYGHESTFSGMLVAGGAADPTKQVSAPEAIVAFGPGGIVVAAHAEPALLDRLHLDNMSIFAALLGAGRGGGKIVTHRPAPEVLIAKSDGWSGGGGGALADLLDDAPDDVVAALVARPHGSPVEQAQVWVAVSTDAARFEAVIRTRSDAAARTIASWAPTAFAQAEAEGRSLPTSCRDTLHSLRDALHVDVDGAVVRADAHVPLTTFAALERCGARMGSSALGAGSP
jgi:hypothetical protein